MLGRRSSKQCLKQFVCEGGVVLENKIVYHKLLSFVMLIPRDVIENAIKKAISTSLPNRDSRRNFNKIRSIEEKIKKLISDTDTRVSLFESLHSEYNKGKEFDESCSYEDMLNRINESNCISECLYILHRCCEDEFDDKYFYDFLETKQFQNTVSNSWKIVEYKESVFPDIKLQENDLSQLDISKTKAEEDKQMEYYIGYVIKGNTSYFFEPQFTYDTETGKFVEIQNPQYKFPDGGTIHLNYEYSFSHKSRVFVDSLNVVENDALDCADIYAIAFKMNELVDNKDENGDLILTRQKRLDLKALCEEREEDLSKRIKPIKDFIKNQYKIVTPKEEISYESFNDRIEINEKYTKGEKVLLAYDGKFFGPYDLEMRDFDKQFYLLPKSAARGYILKYYDIEENEIISFEGRYGKVDVAIIISDEKVKDVISKSELFEMLNSKSNIVATDIPEDIQNSRMKTLKSMSQNAKTMKEDREQIVQSFINTYGDDIISLLDAATIKESKYAKELLNELEHIKSKSGGCDNEKYRTLEEEYIKLKQQIEEISPEELENRRQEYERINILYTQRALEVQEQDKEIAKNETKLNDLKKEFGDYISKELSSDDTSKMLHIAFDPYISNAMIEAAGEYKTKQEKGEYETLAEKMKSLKCERMNSNNELEKYLVDRVQVFRDYTYNEIINMYICMTQNFLTVFSGEPGTGKTSMCEILANSLGLMRFKGNEQDDELRNRYIPVSVERGWSSKRDLIGYFNPLTKKYDKSNGKIYDGLMTLNAEGEDSRFPFVILLDEANLSPIEYYWADFMRATDSVGININIGLEDDVYIPKTLRYLATINNDRTTEELSPRLLDRTWIIKLPKSKPKETDKEYEDVFDRIICWEDLEHAFMHSSNSKLKMEKELFEIYDLFENNHIPVSIRVKNSIKSYMLVAQEKMKDEYDEIKITPEAKALDFAIVQKLLPKIDGYYKNYENLFSKLGNICNKYGLIKTSEQLKFWKDNQDYNMGYCKYLG